MAQWQSANFTSAQITSGESADTADPDHDGLANLAEYALGSDPNGATPALQQKLDGNGLSLTFTRPKDLPNVSYSAESSADLAIWSPVALTVIADGPVQTVRATDPLTGGMNIGDVGKGVELEVLAVEIGAADVFTKALVAIPHVKYPDRTARIEHTAQDGLHQAGLTGPGGATDRHVVVGVAKASVENIEKGQLVTVGGGE